MFKKIILGWLFFHCANLFAQKNGGVFNQALMPGPDGVYVFIMDKTNNSHRPDVSKTFIISKDENGRGIFKKLATVKFPASASELGKRLGSSLTNEIIVQRKLKSAEDLYQQLLMGRLDTLGLYMMDKNVLSALGILYFDESGKQNSNVGYKLEVVNNGVTQFLFQKYLRDVVYSPFPKFKKYKTIISDSALSCTWYALEGNGLYANVIQEGERTKNEIRKLIYKTRDTLFVSSTVHAVPGMHYSFFAIPADLAGNKGQHSDTIRLIASSMTDAVALQNVKVRDTLGGMLLTWDHLQPKPWYTGIRILKSHSAMENYFVMDTLPPNATSWMDQKVIGGTVYYYRLEPIIYDLPVKPNIVPVMVNGIKKFVSEKMVAPQGFEISFTPQRNIRLSWKVDAVPNLFAYYVLRGTSSNNLEVISSPIYDTLYVDSLLHLNPGSTYLYAVAARDMNMKWSDTSVLLSIVSPVNEIVTAPAGLSARYTEHGVRLMWNDVSQTDEKVIGYILYRRKKGEEYFKPIMDHPYQDHIYTDTKIDIPGNYEYGCASMDARGNQSFLSSIASVYVPGSSYLYPPVDFTLKNLQEGIEISIPPTLDKTKDQRYVIYKRTAQSKNFLKVGTIPVEKPVFVDRNVKKGTLYVYAITLTQSAEESEKSAEKTIRRN